MLKYFLLLVMYTTQLFSNQSFESKNIFLWPTYKYKFGSERVKISFPNIPDESLKEGIFYAISESGGCFYILMALDPPAPKADPLVVFSNYIQNTSWEIVTCKTSMYKRFAVLDLLLRDKEISNAQRVIVTDKNVYVLTTVFSNNMKNYHQDFIKTFQAGKK